MVKKAKTQSLFQAVALVMVATLSLAVATASLPVVADHPAAAFPADSLVFVDIQEPVDLINKIYAAPFWPAIAEFLAELRQQRIKSTPAATTLIDLLQRWGEDRQLRNTLTDMAKFRLVVALLATPSGQQPMPIFALHSTDSDRQMRAFRRFCGMFGWRLHTSMSRFGPGTTLHIANRQQRVYFRGFSHQGWIVLTGLEGAARAESLGAVLAGSIPPEAEPLAASVEFQNIMRRLPESAAAHGFVNLESLRIWAEKLPHWRNTTSWGQIAMLGRIDALGIARQIEPDQIGTWVTGRFAPSDPNNALAVFLESLSPITEPLADRFADAALMSADYGASPATLFALGSQIVAELAPSFHRLATDSLGDFRDQTGLDGAVDLIPHLRGNLTVALLPGGPPANDCTIPRPVYLARVSQPEAVRDFLDRWLDWQAGGVAALSQGLFGASALSEEYGGVLVRGLQIEGLLPLPFPLPSPSFAILDDLLIVSPFGAGVREAIAILQSNFVPPPRSVNEPPIGKIVERAHLNMPAFENVWSQCEDQVVSFLSLAAAARHPNAAAETAELVRSLGRSISQFFGLFEPTLAITTIDEEAYFRFSVVIHPRL